ncbi:MAG: glycosyltransferase family 1 protein [Actinobacteria bacterium]|nr:glycosyltransferase family 1 protein [Actinomycetota bacterium]
MGLAVTKSGKILCITNDFGPRAGGIETFVIGLLERLPKGEVVVYTSGQGDTREYDAAWLRDYGVVVHRDKAKILLPTPRVARNVGKVIAGGNFSVAIFGAAAPLALMAGYVRRKGVGRIVALTHGHEVWWAKVFPFNLMIRFIGNNVDALTYLGEFTRSAIAGGLSSKAASVMVKIAPGIDTYHFAPVDASALRASLGLTHKKIIVSVGRLVHRKGQDHLIEAMPEILKSERDAHLLLVGEGPYRKYLEGRVAKLSLTECVTFIGRIQYSELPKYICVGDIFAMPSRSRLAGLEVEGLGIVYLEASACGLPVIAGSSGGAPDAVLEGKTGVVVDGTNDVEIAAAALILLGDEKLRKVMGSAGREWIIDKWRWDIWAKEFRDLLKV